MRIEEIRRGLAQRLRARRPEIEQAVLTRVHAVSEPIEISDPEYAHGLREAASAALDYGLAALEYGGQRFPPIPTVLLAQARLAARANVSLDTVLRRYLAGYTLLGDFVIQEVEGAGLLRGQALQRLLRAQAALLDHVLAAVGEEYAREERERLGSAEERRADRVRRLLAGELLDTSGFSYEFGGHHLGVIAAGPGAGEALDELAKCLDRRLLMIRHEDGAIWAWLGGRRVFGLDQLKSLVTRDWPSEVSVAIGEPATGIAGWRLTHQQAKAAFVIVQHSGPGVVRYADVGLLASSLSDDLLVSSLYKLYLAPLGEGQGDGAVLRETLRAYFAADRHVSSAAVALGVNRHTITSRLRTIEERVGRPLSTCTAEIDTALRLEDLGYPLPSGPAFHNG